MELIFKFTPWIITALVVFGIAASVQISYLLNIKRGLEEQILESERALDQILKERHYWELVATTAKVKEAILNHRVDVEIIRFRLPNNLYDRSYGYGDYTMNRIKEGIASHLEPFIEMESSTEEDNAFIQGSIKILKPLKNLSNE